MLKPILAVIGLSAILFSVLSLLNECVFKKEEKERKAKEENEKQKKED